MSMTGVTVVDEAFGQDFETLKKELDHLPLAYGKKSHAENDPTGHWSHLLTSGTRWNRADVFGMLPWNVKVVLERHMDLMPFEKVMTSAYINGHTFGVEGYYHRDSMLATSTTMVLYLNKEWKPDWGGETSFLNDRSDVFQAVLPKPGRAVMFNGSIPHCARGVSRTCPDLRKTLVLKFRDSQDFAYERVCRVLQWAGSVDLRLKDDHLGRSQHDTGMDIYEFLIDNGFSDKQATAGALSVLDRTYYDLTVRETDDIIATFARNVSYAPLMEINEYITKGSMKVWSDTSVATFDKCEYADKVAMLTLAKYQVERGKALNGTFYDFWMKHYPKN